MLRSLLIKNYALIEEVTVTFDRGLSIITGETGAGKSILLDALGLALGERASADFIRKEAEKAIVEAEFDLSKVARVKKFVEAQGFDCDSDTLVIRREINRKGTSRSFINDTPATLQAIAAVGELLVDLHGQHEHQSLLKPERHVVFLDEYADTAARIAEFAKYYDEFAALKRQYAALSSDRENSDRERSFLEFQLQEIDAVDPKPNEDQAVTLELERLEHSEELQLTASQLHGLLYEDEDSIFERLSAAKTLLERLYKFDPSFATQLEELQGSLESTRELAIALGRYGESIESDPNRLEELRQRELLLTRLKKKYGPTLSEVINLRTKLQDQLAGGGNAEEQLAHLSEQLRSVQTRATRSAIALRDARAHAAKKFAKAIVAELVTLGLEHASFVVEQTHERATGSDEFASCVILDGTCHQATRQGIDHIEFFVSTNKGESPKPLVKVASGGEVSRIMLAIKTALSASEQIPVLIFDEIDTGISGRVAQRVGTAMKRLARKHQIIAITHLGQIAAFGDYHYAVEKQTKSGSTISSLRLLTAAEHEAEIARLLAGEKVTGESLNAARSLVKEAEVLAA
ncbi:MAG: DNA repair protein RecN [Bacteroidetes bacterium]|nr:DNA repair protein RecN [Bacteroidota bacterium]